MTPIEPAPTTLKARLGLSLAAMGVVYGDIGTSPLYAIRECFSPGSGIEVTPANVLGILSLITWSLVIVVTFKFLLLVLRADNQGEGGLLALAHLLVPADVEQWQRRHWTLVGIGLFGAALLFGDGIITPALSVLSAVEGLQVAAPSLSVYVVPIALIILSGLFVVQRFGTAKVGGFFGPIAVTWFTTLGGLGAYQIVQAPEVLWAANPVYAVAFFQEHGLQGTLVLGAVFLTITGAEALYADLGHFGIRPIQASWFALVFPALLLNYFGQGALLIQHPEVVADVFYKLAPVWGVLPLVLLSTLATIIASQAVISGVFSLTSQAVQLDYLPRLRIRHTSSSHYGQIYVPAANGALWLGTVLLVLVFQSSSGLADAYGIAVSLTMVITTLLMYFVMVDVWCWSRRLSFALSAVLLFVDLAFLSSILPKVANGGWIPLSIATFLVVVMAVWRRGRQFVVRQRPAVVAINAVDSVEVQRVYLVRDRHQVHIPDECVGEPVLIHVNQCHQPFMDVLDHGEVRVHANHIEIDACFGFMEPPDIPFLLQRLSVAHHLHLEGDRLEYVWIRETLAETAEQDMPWWMRGAYRFMSRHSSSIPELFRIPATQVREVTSAAPNQQP